MQLFIGYVRYVNQTVYSCGKKKRTLIQWQAGKRRDGYQNKNELNQS